MHSVLALQIKQRTMFMQMNLCELIYHSRAINNHLNPRHFCVMFYGSVDKLIWKQFQQYLLLIR
ncbi:hypothetical protein EAS68_13165 [Legionella jordanis]|nr:hypothetical protein EAS68_13165 [Legionella jordanis]